MHHGQSGGNKKTQKNKNRGNVIFFIKIVGNMQ